MRVMLIIFSVILSGAWCDAATIMRVGRASASAPPAAVADFAATDCWIAAVNGDYIAVGTTNGKPDYTNGTKVMYFKVNCWIIGNTLDAAWYDSDERHDSSGNVPGLTGWVDVAAGGTAPTLAYKDRPIVFSVVPATDVLAGGAAVVITGTGFTDATDVDFGTTAATSYDVDSDTQITATAPAHTAATVAVTVTTAEGTSTDTVNDDFVYADIPNYYAVNAGTANINGTYVPDGTNSTGKKAWFKDGSETEVPDYWIVYDGFGSWVFSDTKDPMMPYYSANSSADAPPTTGWGQSMMGDEPAPTVTHD